MTLVRLRKSLSVVSLAVLVGFSNWLVGWSQDRVIVRATSRNVQESAPAKIIARASSETQHSRKTATRSKHAVKKTSRPKYPTYGNPEATDDPSRDDPLVRPAAVQALGNLMGSIVVVDPANGRVLSVVNQKLAFGGGYQPCSAFKPAVALAALGEGIIDNDRTRLQLGKRWYLDLHKALAISNNLYFEKLGRLLGIDKLERYAHQFGFGEQAGWGIEPEPTGAFPNTPPPARAGGVGKVASFGQGISMTMFQLASFVSAVSNGGTLYYLQYPARADDRGFTPRIKRNLAISSDLDVVRSGMEEAVLTGTARRAKQPDLRLVGKTGTCSQNGARLGWFAGYNKEPGGVVVVVLLRTGKSLGGGPRASEIAGKVFRQLGDANYYARSAWRNPSLTLPASIQVPLVPWRPAP